MRSYSNITKEELDKILAERRKPISVQRPVQQIINRNVDAPCKYAFDTGEQAFLRAPCRGNRIICQHPKNSGFTSYTKQCKAGMCIYYEASE